MSKSKFCSFPAIPLLVRGWVGVGGEKLKIKLNSAQLELDLGLSLAKIPLVSMGGRAEGQNKTPPKFSKLPET